MNEALWYLLVIVGGALFGYGSGWVFDWNVQRKFRKELRELHVSPEWKPDDGA